MKNVNDAERKSQLYAAINSVQKAKEKYIKWRTESGNNVIIWRDREISLGVSNSTQIVIKAPNDKEYLDSAGFSTYDRQRIADAFDEVIRGVYDRTLFNIQEELKQLMDTAL
jgi:hypothetical protein